VLLLCIESSWLDAEKQFFVYGSSKRIVMFIQLTNMSVQHRRKPVLLNSSLIVSITRATVVRDEVTGSSEDITFVFVPPHGTWEVAETLEEISGLLHS
jgi:hypothetical protein